MRKEQAKELVRMIFGDETANDSDIVDFYLQVNKDATQEYADEQSIGFLEWIFKSNIIVNRPSPSELLTIYKQHNGII